MLSSTNIAELEALGYHGSTPNSSLKISNISISKFVKTLKAIRTGIVSLNGQTYPIKAKVPDHIQELLDKMEGKSVH